MAVLVNVIDAAGIEGGRAANDAMDLRRGIYEIMMGAGGMTSDEVRCMHERLECTPAYLVASNTNQSPRRAHR